MEAVVACWKADITAGLSISFSSVHSCGKVHKIATEAAAITEVFCQRELLHQRGWRPFELAKIQSISILVSNVYLVAKTTISMDSARRRRLFGSISAIQGPHNKGY